MSKYLVDTTLLVEHLRGNIKAKVFLEKNSPYISSVSVAELIQGSNNKDDLRFILGLCASLPEFTFDKKISNQAIKLVKKYYLSNGLKFLDALIAATAQENKLTIVTGNIKHFRFIENLVVISQEEKLGNIQTTTTTKLSK